jgi:hypothetical protein
VYLVGSGVGRGSAKMGVPATVPWAGCCEGALAGWGAGLADLFAAVLGLVAFFAALCLVAMRFTSRGMRVLRGYRSSAGNVE